MKMDSDKNRRFYNPEDLIGNDSISRRCSKSLGIQRCNSDGVLTQQNGCQKGRPASKSSSEVSINGICEGLVTQVNTNCTVSDCASAQEKSVRSNNESMNRKTANGIKKDILGRQVLHRKEVCYVKSNIPSRRRVGEKERPDEAVSVGQLNGMEVNMDATTNQPDYLTNVCNTYRHETDFLYGRTRGGINRNEVGRENNMLNGHENQDFEREILVCHPNERISNTSNNLGMCNGPSRSSQNSDICSNNRMPNSHLNYLMVMAPLAVPENLSDEESVSSLSNFENNSRLSALEHGEENEIKNDHEGHLTDLEFDNDLTTKKENGSCESSHPNDISNGANEESDELSIENNKDIPESELVSESEVTLQQEGNQTGGDNQLVENVQQIEEQTRSSSSSSLDSIDDIGDFIEADLPPNVDRLAFFERESISSSTTDEDEGCGDEVLPNANEDEESENETIDPLTHAEQHNISGELISGKLLNNTSAELLSYSNDFTRSPYAFMNSQIEGTCNIFCNRSLEDNEVVNEDPDISNPDMFDGREASGYRVSDIDNFTFPYSYNAEHRNETLPKCENNCVSCDKPVDKSLQRKDEIGVVVCDKCFNERDFDKNKKSENVARKKIRTVSQSCSTNRLSYINSNGRANSQDKVNNASHSSMRLSSSDSDPFDRLYVSDSSEMVSPDVDTGVESVFKSSSTSSDGTSVQYNQINGAGTSDDRRLSGNICMHRQSVSLEYETPDEVLYCPYYTRRSRSLDQDLTLNGAANLSPERDIPNISVTSSNFQDDESNNQEKVFDKRPYNVEPPIPTYSSSDEEENTRVPAPYSNHTDMQDENGPGSQSDMNSLMYLHSINNPDFGSTPQNIIVADEPIYEDIEDLELLLEGASDAEQDIRSSTQPLCNAITKLRRKKRTRSPVSDIEKVMIWNEYEAYVVQVKQIGTSACGPTAVLNVLKAFDFQVEKEEVTQKITSTMRMEAAPIPYYLFSRYSAGTTAQALVDGVNAVTRGAIKGRFFHFYPKRDVELLKWLGHWMKKGAVPVATLNLQRGVKPGWTIPDAWHHQMVYGVSSKGVYLTNPLEIVPESVILEQLTSDSILLVRKQDVVSRFRDWCPLNEILKQRDPRWMTMNVLGQIVHMLREQYMPQEQQSATKSLLTSHIHIPAAYKAGIILYMRSNSEFFNELMQAPELPVKNNVDES